MLQKNIFKIELCVLTNKKKVTCETFNFFQDTQEFEYNLVILKFLLTFHFGLIMKSQKLYNIIILLNCFEQYFLSSNTVISDSFGKNIFVTLTSHLPKFSYMSLLLASYHDDINDVGATEKIFYENELCIMQDKGKSKVMTLCF